MIIKDSLAGCQKIMNKNKAKEKVIVTGATGFVGQHLIPRLLQHGYDVLAIAREENRAQSFDWINDVEFVASDISKGAKHLNINAKMSLIHLAWSGLPNYNSTLHFEENLPKSYEFIKSCIECGVSQVLVTGTCFEYGFQSGPISSDTRPCPSNPYAFAKDALRQQLEFLVKDNPFSLLWARLFYIYGKGQNPKSVLSQLDTAINNNDPTFNMSYGEQLRDYLPVEAVAQQLYDLYIHKKEGTYNICSGTPISIKRLVEDRICQSNSSIKLNLGYYPYSDYEPMAFWGIRDIGETLYLPPLPNATLRKKEQSQTLAPVRLRLNKKLNFVENEAFDENLIDYGNDYENSQAQSVEFQEHMRVVLKLLKKQLKQGSNIVEVGCGKGDFVELVQTDGSFKITGYDSAYEGKNPSVKKRYLNANDRIKTDLVVLRHVLKNVPNPYKFLSMLKTVFGNSKIFIEVPNYDWIVTKKTFFDIRYEHTNYFSKDSFKKLFNSSATEYGHLFGERYQYLFTDLITLNIEFRNLYESNDWEYISFADLFPNILEDIKRLEIIAKEGSIYLWGAATKGCLFLSHCVNNNRLIEKVVFAVDQNPRKIGRFLPGSNIEIKSKEDFFRSVKPKDLLIISNPAFQEEIIAELRAASIHKISIETL